MKQRLFVYGTLKNGFPFHEGYLGNGKSRFVSRAMASPDYSLYVGAQPHLIREKTTAPAKGELYEIDTPALEAIDYLEGHPVVYKREIIEICTEEGEKLLAWAYLRHPNFGDKKLCFKEEEYI